MTKKKPQAPETEPIPVVVAPPSVAPIEVELKALVPNNRVGEVKNRLLALGYKLAEVSNQQNWYYLATGSLTDLVERVRLMGGYIDLPEGLIINASASVRTRAVSADNHEALLVIKVSTNGESSENGTSRTEYNIPATLSLTELDTALTNSGFIVRSKWSRLRRTYTTPTDRTPIVITLDKNSGYGTMLEAELMVDGDHDAAATKALLLDELAALGLTELPQDRLERMFAHYEASWWNYYGTELTFEVL